MKTPSQRALVDITRQVSEALDDGSGAWLIYVPHTTAGLTINEGADPDVAKDLLMAWERLAPAELPYRHVEGNSPAHVMTSLVGSSVVVPVEDGELQLGRWQSLFLCEFDGPRTREVRLRKL